MNLPSSARLRHVSPPLVLALAALFAQSLGSLEALRLERGLWLEQPWRLITGQLMHLGWTHLAMNLAGLGVVWLILARHLPTWQWWLTVLICGAGVNLGLLAFSTSIDWYVGLSGLLHGLLAAGALAGLGREPLAAWVLVLLGIKLLLEQFTGHAPLTGAMIGASVIVDAHLYGALAGLLLASLWRLMRRSQR
jgi:rhomboid family GlyGly-CTERM serine protease